MVTFLSPPSNRAEKITPSTHRFFSDLITAQFGIAAIYFRYHFSDFESIVSSGPLQTSTICLNFDYEIDIDARELLVPLYAKWQMPEFLNIEFRHTPTPSRPENLLDEGNPYQKMFGNMFHQCFIAYYEKHRLLMHEKHGANTKKWPDVLRFARALRNAFAHGGHVSIHNKDEEPVSWGRLTYSPAENGRKILYNDLSNGDLIVLMFEMDATF